MIRWLAALAVVVCLSPAATAHAQTAAVEVGQSVGVSTEDIAGAGTQVRVLGEALPGLRFDRSSRRTASISSLPEAPCGR
jgi:hypothetical protein